MAAPGLKQITLIPDLPRDSRVADEKGMLTPAWKLFFEQMVLVLQNNLKVEGFVMPQQTSSNIAQLITAPSKANIVYDSTTDEFKGNIQTGPNTFVWKTFTLT